MCEVSRPLYMFSRKSKTRAHHFASRCRPCDSGGLNGQLRNMKARGVPLSHIQRMANEKCDMIAAAEGLPAWNPAKHKSELERVSYAPLRGKKREEALAELTEAWLERERKRSVRAPDSPRAAQRRARKAAEKELSAREKEAKKLALEEKRKKRFAAMSPVELLEDSLKRSVKAFTRARGRANTSARKASRGTVARVTLDRPGRLTRMTLAPEDVAELITRSQLKCEVTGVNFDLRDLDVFKPRYALSPSLDQVIPGRGYTPKNTRLVAYAWNVFKLDTDEDAARANFLRMANGLRKRAA